MITPKELYDINRSMLDQHIDYDKRGFDCIINTIKEFGNMMYNQALEDAVENATVYDQDEGPYGEKFWYVNEDSILKLKK